MVDKNGIKIIEGNTLEGDEGSIMIVYNEIPDKYSLGITELVTRTKNHPKSKSHPLRLRNKNYISVIG